MSPIAAATMPMRREKIPLLVERVVTIAGLPGRRCFPGTRRCGFHADPHGVDCRHPRTEVLACPVPLEPASVGVVRSGGKGWGLVGAESHRNRERMRFNGRRRHLSRGCRWRSWRPATGRRHHRARNWYSACRASPTAAIDVGPPAQRARFVHVPVNHHGSCPRRQ